MMPSSSSSDAAYFTIAQCGNVFTSCRTFTLNEDLEIIQIRGDSNAKSAIVLIPSSLATHLVLNREELGVNWDYATENVAYQIEDQLFNSVEENCIAWHTNDTRIDVYVTNRALIEGLINTLLLNNVFTTKAIAQQNVFTAILPENSATQFTDCLVLINEEKCCLVSTLKDDYLFSAILKNGISTQSSIPTAEHSIDFCIDQLTTGGLNKQLASLLPQRVQQENALREKLRRFRPAFISLSASLVFVLIYLASTSVIINSHVNRLNDDSRKNYGIKFGSSQSFEDVERLAKLQISSGKPIQKMVFENLLAEMSAPLRTRDDDSVKTTNIFFDETRGITVAFKFSTLEQYEQYTQALKEKIEFDIKEIATTPDGTFATFIYPSIAR